MMVADYFTKPLQGALFHKFRDVIMGFKHVNTLKKPDINVESKERVVINDKEILSNCEKEKVKHTNKKRVSFQHPEFTYADAVRGAQRKCNISKGVNERSEYNNDKQ